MNTKNLTVIAEIGVNHEGDLPSALKMMVLAAEAGAHFVKFQSYTPARFACQNDQARFERVSKFALKKEHFDLLAAKAAELKVGFLSTPLTEDWVEILEPMCQAFKIASGDLTFEPTIRAAAKTGKQLLISTGGANTDEISKTLKWVAEEIGQENLKERVVLMHCVSAYPTPIEQANILSIPFMREKFDVHVGYSNHVMGYNACLAAVALGANVIEVHFTDQKEGREFRDHQLSLDQKDLKNFIALAKEVHASLGSYDKCPQECECDMIPLMRKGIVAAHDMAAGHTITSADLMFARPAIEFTSSQVDDLVGKKLKAPISEGHLIKKELI